jgi:hypothetical protein
LEAWAFRAEEFSNRAESIEACIESFLRGFCGDPLGTYQDLRSEAASLVAGLFREATPEEIGRGEGVESEVPPRYVIKAADVIRVLREIHETGKAPKLDE